MDRHPVSIRLLVAGLVFCRRWTPQIRGPIPGLARRSLDRNHDALRGPVRQSPGQIGGRRFQKDRLARLECQYRLLKVLRTAAKTASPSQTDGDLEPNRFGGSPYGSTEANRHRRFDFRLDMGTVYNSNVQLAPVSRVVSSPGSASVQGLLSPQLEYRFLSSPDWRAGTSLRGYFNFNESEFRQFDLQDYQSGVFLERSLFQDWGELIARTQYDFTLDEFAGSTFGKRHALTNVLSINWQASVSSVYWTIDYSNFRDDGVTPQITSLDGWTNTLGFSHTKFFELGRLEYLR